jgi:Tol biopolymer transport system component
VRAGRIGRRKGRGKPYSMVPGRDPDRLPSLFGRWLGYLYLATVGEGRERRLTSQPGDDVGAAWSRGGTRLAFERSEVPSAERDNTGTFDIYVISADGRSLRRLTENSGGVSWRPAGAAAR